MDFSGPTMMFLMEPIVKISIGRKGKRGHWMNMWQLAIDGSRVLRKGNISSQMEHRAEKHNQISSLILAHVLLK